MYYDHNLKGLNSEFVDKMNQSELLYMTDEGRLLFNNGNAVFLDDHQLELDLVLRGKKKNSKFLILFGVGDGRYLDAIREYFPDLERLIIIEPDMGYLKLSFREFDYKKLSTQKLIIDLYHSRDLQPLKEKLFGLFEGIIDFDLIALPSYIVNFQELYSNLVKAIQDILIVRKDNLNTFTSSFLQWNVNQIKNLKYSIHHIEDYKDYFKGKNVIIVGAGPSLNKNIHLLEKLKEHAVLIAAGSAIKILNKNNIIPDFRIAIDGLPREMKLIGDIEDLDVPLLYSDMLYFEFLPTYNAKKTIHFISEEEIISNDFYETKNHKRYTFRSGGSVTNSAFDICSKMEAKRIILMGQDLAYENDKLHADGAWEDKSRIKGTMKHEYVKMKNIYGEEVNTIKPFLTVKHSFELYMDYLADTEKTQYLNATEGGLPIRGIPNISAEDLLNLIGKDQKEAFEFIEDLREVEPNLIQYFKKINEDLRHIYDVISDLNISLYKIKDMLNETSKKNKIMHEVEYYKKKFAIIQTNNTYRFLLQRMTDMIGNVGRVSHGSEEELKRAYKIEEMKLAHLKSNVIALVKTIEAELAVLEGKNE